MYVGLFVKNECKRSVKNKIQKMNQWNLRLARKKQPAKWLCVEHMSGS